MIVRDVDGCKIINVYTPPLTRLQTSDFLVFSHPRLNVSNFILPHPDLGYDTNKADEDCLATWENSNNLALLYNIIQRTRAVSIPVAGTLAPTQICFLRIGPNSRLPTDQL